MTKFYTAIPKTSYGHFAIGPVNWSTIIEITKEDVTNPGSDAVDDREVYYLKVRYYDNDEPAHWDFQQDQELRDKVYDLIVHHQCHELKSCKSERIILF